MDSTDGRANRGNLLARSVRRNAEDFTLVRCHREAMDVLRNLVLRHSQRHSPFRRTSSPAVHEIPECSLWVPKKTTEGTASPPLLRSREADCVVRIPR